MKQWMGKWIGFPQCPADVAPVFQKVLQLSAVPEQAQVLVSGLGCYVLYINGQRVGEDILQPAFTDYNKTVFYNHYDVTQYLRDGENVLEVILGNTWYHEQQATDWLFHTAPWKDFPRLLLELWAGERLLCKTDSSWLCAQSKIFFNSLRCGERYDATRQVSFTRHATVVPPPAGVLKEQNIQPIRVSAYLEPVNCITQARYWGSNTAQLIYDFGVNLTGNLEITVKGARGGSVRLSYFEKLLDNGLPDTCQLTGGLHRVADRDSFQKEVYILSGEGEEKWHSEFCYHGFRYVAVQGEFESLSLRARFFHTALNPAGNVETDHTVVAMLHSAVKQSALTNYHHIPTDCPHREKLGWTADGYLSVEQMLYNFDMRTAYGKWMDDFVDSQQKSGTIPCIVPSTAWGHSFNCGPCWDLALFEIPWQLYRHYADTSYLRQTFEAQKKYMDYLPGILEDGVCSFGLSDWLAPVNFGAISPDEAVITMACGRICERFAQCCAVLGETEAACEANSLRDHIRRAYVAKYADLDIPSQTLYAMELAFGFCDDRDATFRMLVRNVEAADCQIRGGVFAAKYVLDVLSENGRFDLAYRMATQPNYPGWVYMANVNSGTLGEDWGGGKSGNHHLMSHIGAWFYKALAGIQIDENAPGFARVKLQPHIPEDMTNFCGWHDTAYGRVCVSWDAEYLYVDTPVPAQLDWMGSTVTLQPGSYRYNREA